MKHTENFWKFSDTHSKVFFFLKKKKKRIRKKIKNIMNPWVTKVIAKSSKRNQRLYEKNLKKCTRENEEIYKNYTSF